MTAAVQASQQRIEKIMTMKHGVEAQSRIGKRLHEIIDSCLEIDMDPAAAQKRQRVAED